MMMEQRCSVHAPGSVNIKHLSCNMRVRMCSFHALHDARFKKSAL